jgi:hypothetical protein
MSKQDPNREAFIQLYRKKLQNDLQRMGYLGAKEDSSGSNQPLIIDAGSELPNLDKGTASRTRPEAVQQ